MLIFIGAPRRVHNDRWWKLSPHLPSQAHAIPVPEARHQDQWELRQGPEDARNQEAALLPIRWLPERFPRNRKSQNAPKNTCKNFQFLNRLVWSFNLYRQERDPLHAPMTAVARSSSPKGIWRPTSWFILASSRSNVTYVARATQELDGSRYTNALM